MSGGLLGGTRASMSSKNSSEVTVGERSTALSSKPINVIELYTFTESSDLEADLLLLSLKMLS